MLITHLNLLCLDSAGKIYDLTVADLVKIIAYLDTVYRGARRSGIKFITGIFEIAGAGIAHHLLTVVSDAQFVVIILIHLIGNKYIQSHIPLNHQSLQIFLRIGKDRS